MSKRPSNFLWCFDEKKLEKMKKKLVKLREDSNFVTLLRLLLNCYESSAVLDTNRGRSPLSLSMASFFFLFASFSGAIVLYNIENIPCTVLVLSGLSLFLLSF